MVLSLPRTIPFVEIRWHRAIVAVALDVDLFHAATVNEVVHVGAAPGAGEGVGNIAQGEPQRHGFVVIDIHLKLRHLRQIVGAHGVQRVDPD